MTRTISRRFWLALLGLVWLGLAGEGQAWERPPVKVKTVFQFDIEVKVGPDGMLMSENATLYARHGIATTVGALRAGGSIVYWSVGEDPKFVRALRGAGLEVVAHQVRAHETTGPMHVLYVGVRRR